MKDNSDKSHQPAKIGDNVTIPIPDVDKGKGDLRNIIGVILQKNDEGRTRSSFQIAGIGQVNSFGLIFRDFIIETDSSAKWIATAHGIFSIMLAIGGLILNVMAKKYSLRSVGFIGALLTSLGSFLTVFINNTNQIPLTFGILQGIGFGIIAPVCYSTFNYYFTKDRTRAMSLIKAIQGIILVCYPQILKILLSYYGFRSTLLIITGVALHTFPGIAIMNANQSFRKKKSANINNDKQIKGGEDVGLISNPEIVDRDVNRTKENKKPNPGFGNIILEVLNVKILKDPIFCNISIGQSFVNFSDLLFFILEPMLLYQYGFDTNQVAACISISAGADVAGRFALAVISSMMSVNTRLLFFVTTLLTLLFRIVILQVRQFIWVSLLTGFLGVLRAWLHVSSPLVISDHIPHEDFTAAYAVFMLSTGIVNAVTSPIIELLTFEVDSIKNFIIQMQFSPATPQFRLYSTIELLI
ncbi:monocarboxylate transporter [Danaus plexippus plexippus]|uniref:Monocarboxylate transporter n=1 Tax=Danaus plexippus plexippus TaxID=278856 RepID=A0A212F801_DANPL|nr:monocarboxylate transporter [Danaus plexippus plexippus]